MHKGERLPPCSSILFLGATHSRHRIRNESPGIKSQVWSRGEHLTLVYEAFTGV